MTTCKPVITVYSYSTLVDKSFATGSCTRFAADVIRHHSVRENKLDEARRTAGGTLRVSPFVRFNVALGVLAFGLLPFIPLWDRIHAGQMNLEHWAALGLSITIMQSLLLLVQKRCSSEEMPFWRGLMVIGHSMRTRWLYLDVLIALVTVPVALIASIAFTLSRNPAERYHRLVYGFYQNRMEQ